MSFLDDILFELEKEPCLGITLYESKKIRKNQKYASHITDPNNPKVLLDYEPKEGFDVEVSNCGIIKKSRVKKRQERLNNEFEEYILNSVFKKLIYKTYDEVLNEFPKLRKYVFYRPSEKKYKPGTFRLKIQNDFVEYLKTFNNKNRTAYEVALIIRNFIRILYLNQDIHR